MSSSFNFQWLFSDYWIFYPPKLSRPRWRKQLFTTLGVANGLVKRCFSRAPLHLSSMSLKCWIDANLVHPNWSPLEGGHERIWMQLFGVKQTWHLHLGHCLINGALAGRARATQLGSSPWGPKGAPCSVCPAWMARTRLRALRGRMEPGGGVSSSFRYSHGIVVPPRVLAVFLIHPSKKKTLLHSHQF